MGVTVSTGHRGISLPDKKQPVRSILSLRSLSIRVLVPSVCLLSALSWPVAPVFAQQATPQTAPAPAPAPATKSAAPTSTAPAQTEPDYPDPRSVSLGIYYLSPVSSNGADIRSGTAAFTTNETIPGLGKYRGSIAADIGVAISRTGVLYLDLERINSAGNQITTRDILRRVTAGPYTYAAGDYLATTARVSTGRLYLDDLLFPHKFPVARLRFKSIWAVRYMNIHATVDAPQADVSLGAIAATLSTTDTHIFLPEIGAAMEYAVARHTVFRIDGAGFGLPHRSDLGEGSATLAVREKHLEIVVGFRALHFKTNPSKETYAVGTVMGGFGGLRWHW